MIPGFRFEAGALAAIPAERVADLASAFAWSQPTVRVYGHQHLTPRLTAWFGAAPYTYSGVRHDAAPMPDSVHEIAVAVEHLVGVRFNSVLANYYRDGRDSVAWHADDEPELGDQPVIASVSLGATRAFAVKPRAQDDDRRWSVPLRHGDVLVMDGRSQLDYLHAIPKTVRPVGARINLTFRQL